MQSLALKMEEEGHESSEQPQEAGKGKEKDSPLELPKRNAALLLPQKLMLDFYPTELLDNMLALF